MAITDSRHAREFIKELERQPKQFVFGEGAVRAIFTCIMALITPMKRDDESGKMPAQAHILLQDFHGRGKTAILIYLAASLKAKISRIEGSFDKMPSELKGSEERDLITGTRTLLKGPLHCHILSYDELTRTSSKSLNVLLSAMEGAHVKMNVTNKETGLVESTLFPLFPIPDDPKGRNFFIVVATANPVDLEGTFPLSEAQKDRFTYQLKIGLPAREDEMKIRSENLVNKKIEVVGDLSDLSDTMEMVDSLRLSNQANELIQRHVDNSRPYSLDMEDNHGKPRKRFASPDLLEFVNEYVASGCSPRRNLHMQAAAKAYAWMSGEDEIVKTEHVQAIAPATMEHVLMLKSNTLFAGITPKKIVEKIIQQTLVPK